MTTAISFCEPIYAVHPSVAEFWNSISSLAYCVAAWIFFKELAAAKAKYPQAFPDDVFRRFTVCGICMFALGLGSAVFHGTLTWWGELWDEGAMYASILSYIYCQQDLHPVTSGSRKWIFYTIITCVGVIGISLYLHLFNHDIFASVFALLIAIAGFLLATSPVLLTRPHDIFVLLSGDSVRVEKVGGFRLAVALAATGYASWWVDQTCVRWEMQQQKHWMFWFHVLWHLCTALALRVFLKLIIQARIHMAVFARTQSGSFLRKKKL
jgi:hypothetical protein